MFECPPAIQHELSRLQLNEPDQARHRRLAALSDAPASRMTDALRMKGLRTHR